MLRRLNKGGRSSWSKNNFYFWQLESIKDDPDKMRASVISLEPQWTPPTNLPANMTNSVLTSVLVLLAGLSLVLAGAASQTEREAKEVIVSETLQVVMPFIILHYQLY